MASNFNELRTKNLGQFSSKTTLKRVMDLSLMYGKSAIALEAKSEKIAYVNSHASPLNGWNDLRLQVSQ
jgi:hypothetical protein